VNGALGIVSLFVAFACLVYAAKGSSGTQWDGKIAPGPVLGSLLVGKWPYTGASSSSSSSGGGGFQIPTPIPGVNIGV
jgi:hypothetical protein